MDSVTTAHRRARARAKTCDDDLSMTYTRYDLRQHRRHKGGWLTVVWEGQGGVGQKSPDPGKNFGWGGPNALPRY